MKAYHLHEHAYRQMQRDGIPSWDLRKARRAIDPEVSRFLADVFAQPWVPRTGRVLELGCGTAPILRSLVKRGFSGVGVDVSASAIRMGRAQSRGTKVSLHVGDVTRMPFLKDASFDLVIDGHCLHCLVDDADRRAFHREVARLLRPEGCFVLQSMARPLLPRTFARVAPGRLRGEVLYQAVPHAREGRGAIRIDGEWHAPLRRFEHWRAMLRTLERHGLVPRLLRVVTPSEKEPLSGLSVAAQLRPAR
jgi:SAM-dependent methyltransferase